MHNLYKNILIAKEIISKLTIEVCKKWNQILLRFYKGQNIYLKFYAMLKYIYTSKFKYWAYCNQSAIESKVKE